MHRVPYTLHIFIILCFILLIYINLLAYKMESMTETTNRLETKNYFIHTEGCSIPELPIIDEKISKFVYNESKLICNDNIPALFDSDAKTIILNQQSLPYYKINNSLLLNCSYESFRRIEPKKNNVDKSIKYDEPIYLKEFNKININKEFIRVKCFYDGREIYKDFFHFVQMKKFEKTIANKMNVLIIGIDAVSRLNFYRQMPETVNFLLKIGAIDLKGFNKVADNTFPNLIPLLTGLSEDELTCWPNQTSYFDDCPFLWKLYKKKGYITAFGEDAADIGLFYYLKYGFKKQQIDYFWDYFSLKARAEIGKNECIGSRMEYKMLLDYIDKFTSSMNDLSYFGFFWSASLTHDYLNKPKLGDHDFKELIETLYGTGRLDNTFLIVMSDHGIRWGEIRTTYQGMLEERLPFAFIRSPNTNDNLEINARRLTTHFDLHETLKDVLGVKHSNTERGISLLSKIIPDDRTCDSAGIAPHWCTCQNTETIDVGSTEIIEIVSYVINDHINQLLSDFKSCARLELTEILSARVHKTNEYNDVRREFVDFTVSFKTIPGDAIYESTVRRFDRDDGRFHFNVTGSVSRLNLYGGQSNCVQDFHLKLYCFCLE